MAERYAVSAGNWVAARFDGDTLPGPDDTVHANGYAVTVDVSITVAALSTRPGAVAVAGGSFTTSGAVVVNAESYAGTTTCLRLASSSGSIQNGNSHGSNTTNNCFGTLANIGTTQNGNAYGGNGSYRFGSDILSGTLNGNCHGGSSGAAGAHVRSNAKLNGNTYGGTTAGSVGCYLSFRSIQVGNSYGSGAATGSEVTNGSIHRGDSFGGTGPGSNARGSNLYASFHIGNATGGTVPGNGGTNLDNGAIFVGSAIGGSISFAEGVSSGNGSVIVLTGAQNNAAKAARIGVNTAIILKNGTTAADTITTAAAGTYEIATDNSPNYPFLSSSVSGFTGILGLGGHVGT